MGVLVITPPEALVSLTLAKQHLRVTTDVEDALIQSYIDAASSWLDGPNGTLKRAVGQQVLEVSGAGFPTCAALPCGPVRSIVEVGYVDADGVDRILPDDQYVVGPTDRLTLAHGAVWPAVRGDVDGVRVRYQAGFEKVPAPIQQAVLLLIAQWFRNRSAVNVGNIVNELPNGVKALLSPFKIRKF